MHIVSALFVDRYDTRPAPGPSTRLDLNGVFFSIAAPSPVPVTIEPHLLEPGRFTYRLVRSELEMAAPGRVVAHCRVGTGPWHLVPLTVVAP